MDTGRDIPVYIWTPTPDTLTEHRTLGSNEDRTRCGITYESLPTSNQAELDAGYDTPDKPWYYDHDRDDVVPCKAGCLAPLTD